MRVEKIEICHEDNIGIFHLQKSFSTNHILKNQILKCGVQKSTNNLPQVNHKITGINFFDFKNDYFLKLKSWISYCAEKFMAVDADKLKGVYFEDIWANWYDQGEYIAKHRHLPNTYAFVYFLQSTKDHPPLVFDGSNFSFYGCSGDLVIFNASLWHHVDKNKINLPRITISGNIQSKSILAPNYEKSNSNIS